MVCLPQDFKVEALPPHLTMNFKVIDEHGRQLAMGRNLASLRADLGAQAQATFQQIAAADAKVAEGLQDRITDWDFGDLPELLEIRRAGQTLVGHPALVDRGDYCSLEVYDDAAEAQARHREGLQRLFRLQLREQIKFLEKSLNGLQTAQIQASTVPALAAAFSNFESLREQLVATAIDRVCLAEPWPNDAASFAARRQDARGKLNLIAQELARLVQAIVAEAVTVSKKLPGVRSHAAAVADVEQQLQRLFSKRFLVVTPPAQLAHYPRYLKAIAARFDRLKADPARDAARLAEITQFQVPWLRELAARKGVGDPRLEEFRWLLEELRVSLFAQELRTPMPVSTKRLQKVWDNLQR